MVERKSSAALAMIPFWSSEKTKFQVRPAIEADRQHLASLIHFETHVHRHLDWQAPLDWIGQQPFLVALKGEDLVAGLSCPMDLPGVAWIRLFAVGNRVEPQEAWDVLWEQARLVLVNQPGCVVAAIPLQTWMVELLERSGFVHGNDVIILKWESGMRMPEPQTTGITIRPMQPDDLDRVQEVDALAFQPMWQNSYESLKMAHVQAAVATVALDPSGIVGYQISTSSQMGGHIARLAVLPRYQGRNIGYALIYDVLRQFERRLVFRVTVNTQRDNLVSQSLYLKAGFHRTGENYLVYQDQIS